MKRHILSLTLVGAFAATTLVAQDESPTPFEESTPTPATSVAPTATPAPTVAAAAATPQQRITRKKREAGTIKLGDGEDSLTINFGGGAPEAPEPPELPGAPDVVDAHTSVHRHENIREDANLAILKNVVLPIVAIVFLFGGPVVIVALVLFYRMKKNRLLHQTITNLVASGQPIPPELLHTARIKAIPTPSSDLRKGIILCMVGLGLIGFFIGVGGPWGLGCIPLAWGGGHLLMAKFVPKGTPSTTDKL